MWDARAESERWLQQAANDLEFARFGMREPYYAQVCFLAQQAAEKALKSIVGGVPFEAFGESQAVDAVEAADRFVRLAERRARPAE